jgi:transcriptional regulator with XRE-family HTH domain
MTSTDVSTSRQQRAQTDPPFNSKPVRTAMHVAPTKTDSNAMDTMAGARQGPFSALVPLPTAKAVAATNDREGGTEAHDADAPKRRLARHVVGPRLCAAREIAGLSQTAAATGLGYATPAQLNQHEQGRRLMPLPELIRAAEIYGTSVEYLVGTTNEPERDPARALRAAAVRGLRGMLDGMAERMTDEIGRFAALCGPDATNARAVLAAGTKLLDALGFIQRNPEFDDLPGGATVVRVAREFEDRLRDVREAIARFDALDLALRERVRTAVAANDEELDILETENRGASGG